MFIKIRGALIWIIVFQAIGYFIGSMTQHDILSWYPTLQRSALNPPSIVFPIVWFILYCMIAVSGYLLWQNRHQKTAQYALVFFSLQMLLNWAWSPMFFYFHWIGASFFCIVGIIIFTIITMIIARNKYKLSCNLLMPYLIWLLFAGYLNATIWLLN